MTGGILNWDDGTDRRYELLDGVPVMMAPALEAHGELAAGLAGKTRARVKPPCRVISEAGLPIPDRADTCTFADLALTCAPREPGRRMVVEPVLLVEVPSPSTGQVDRWRKVADYRTLTSVREILVVFSDERRLEVQRRTADGWRGRGPDRQGGDRAVLLPRPHSARCGLSGSPRRGSCRIPIKRRTPEVRRRLRGQKVGFRQARDAAGWHGLAAVGAWSRSP